MLFFKKVFKISPYNNNYKEPGRKNPTTTSTGEMPVLRFYIDVGMTINYLETTNLPFCLRHHRLNDTPPIHPEVLRPYGHKIPEQDSILKQAIPS